VRWLSLSRRLFVILSLVAGVDSTWAGSAPPKFDVTTIAIASGTRGSPREPANGVSADSLGNVVFVASENGADALFLRTAIGFTIRLLAAGEDLEGSTVARLVTMPNSLDAFRQVLFYAVLADGRAGLFLATPPPSASSISPAWGYRDRTTIVHLTGNGFTPGVRVRLGDVQVGFITVISQTELTGIVPAGAPAGDVDLTIGRAGGISRSLPKAFEFRDPPVSGCRGLFPDHQPPKVTASSLLSGWVPWAVVALYALARHRRR
jgi:hypothetical protein